MADYILREIMQKRAIMKSRFTIENYKSRWFILTSQHLTYHEGSPEKGPGKEKGKIQLCDIKSLESMDDPVLMKKHVFQMVYTPKSEKYILYIVAMDSDQRSKWLTKLREACKLAGAQMSKSYHPGIYQYSSKQFSCCQNIDRRSAGCQNTSAGTLINNNENITSTTGLKRVVALYDYDPAEQGDLELIRGDEYDVLSMEKTHWWLVVNSRGEQGYIPANYIEEVTESGMEKFDWFHRNMTRGEAETTLRREGKEGYFIVRESRTRDTYSLSVFTRELGGTTKHYHIKQNTSNKYYISENHTFESIPMLVFYHQHNSAGLVVRLRKAPQGTSQPATAGFGHDMLHINRSEISIGKELGHGQFGSVFLGTWRGGRKVAVKMMQKDAMSEDDFIGEAEVMTKLNHHCLVQLYGICSGDDQPIYLVTEFMAKGDLLSCLRKEKYAILSDANLMKSMCNQVASGMEYLESQQFIHRDLAARNCLVGSNQMVKVGDFGLARFVLDDEYTSSSGTKFPIKWAPPEVLQYTRFSSKSDVWAYGVLMWEIYTGGELPYGRMRNPDVVDHVVKGHRLERPSSCPRDIYEIMEHCWERVPDHRPTFTEIEKSLEFYRLD